VSILNLLFHVPHIITLHATFDSATIRGRGVWFKKQVIWFFLSRANVVNVVSSDAKENLIEYFAGAGRYLHKIVVIGHGIDMSFFRQEEGVGAQRQLTAIKGIEDGSFVVGYLGRFMPEKGFPVLIDAIERLVRSPASTQNLKVLALGWGAYIREYQALISGKGLNEYFVFIEYQPDVRWVLRQIDVLVIPSLREAFSLLAVEGLVCGAPIIASNCIGLREVLKGTPARLVTPGEPAELADAILEMMNVQKRNEARSFMSTAVKRFDVSVAAEKLDVLFTALAE
jgi:glycosyltransferase involved in cell wall biosynthesis